MRKFTKPLKKKQSRSLSVRLEYSKGREPDESLNFGDINEIESKFGPIINHESRTAGIPLTFSNIEVPTHYFGK